jgi:hypothetical protein
MFSEATIGANVTVTTPTTFALGSVTGARVGFSVEEAEMITEVEFFGSVASSVADQPVDFTFFLDGVDMADLVDGLCEVSMSHIATQPTAVCINKKLRIPQGAHVVTLQVRAASGNVIVDGLLRPAKLRVLRWSHNATVAPAQNSKQTSGVY